MRTDDNKRDHYINKVFAQEDRELFEIRETLRADGKEGINVGPHEGKFLQLLISLIGAKRIVEVGTLYGYSTLWMARALPEDGKVYSLELSEENHSKAQKLLENTNAFDRVQLIQGDAVQRLKELEADGPYDLIFIDANKAGYLDYLDWAERNIRKGGLIVGDNTFLFGHLIGEASTDDMNPNTIEVMKSFNNRLSDPDKYNSTLIPTSEGMTVALKLY